MRLLLRAALDGNADEEQERKEVHSKNQPETGTTRLASVEATTSRPDSIDTPGDQRLYARITCYIETHLTSPQLNAATLQKLFCVSRSRLYRLFGPVGGVARYIRARRLDLAYECLSEAADCNITRLLYDLGFESDRQFQRAFRARFGVSPMEVRQRPRDATATSAD